MLFHQQWQEWSAWLWPLLLNHLWQATICFGVAWCLAFALRNASAQFRAVLWAAVLLKFLLPSVLLLAVLRSFGMEVAINIPAIPTDVSGGQALWLLTQPLPSRDGAAPPALQTIPIPSLQVHPEWFCLFSLLWLGGIVVLLVRWGRSRRKMMSLLRNAADPSPRVAGVLSTLYERMSLRRQVSLQIVSDAVEPGVWRIGKPIIFLPQRLADQLSDEELEAVLLHELAHVAQRDNLYLLLQRLLCLVCWFHPLVWLLQRYWIAERELLCDEKVLRQGVQPELYVTSLWKVAQFGVGWSSASISAANGSNLKRRITQILSNDSPPLTRGWFVLAAAVLFVILLAVSVPLTRPLQTSAQQIQVLPGIYKNGDNAKKKAQLDTSPEIPIQFENLPNVPLTITDAQLQAVKFTQEIAPARLSTGCTFRIILVLHNQTARKIVGIAYEIADSPSSRGGLMEYHDKNFPDILPHDSITFGRTITSFGDCRLFPEPISQMTIRIAGVQFESESHWGSFHSYTTGMPIRPAMEIYANGIGPTISEETKQIAAGQSRESDAGDVYELPEVTTAPILLTNERPAYPNAAVEQRVKGLVVLQAVFRADGQVSSLQVIKGLPAGLTESAIETTRRIRFQPATKDGRPVSVRMHLEYRFGG